MSPTSEGRTAPQPRRVLLTVHTGRRDIVALARSSAARLQAGGIVVRSGDRARHVGPVIESLPMIGAQERVVVLAEVPAVRVVGLPIDVVVAVAGAAKRVGWVDPELAAQI